jgi:uncharacterized cysteine cluster protein YcgN (CxxCxxCC family)
MAYTIQDLIYICGFFDGEGCVCCDYRRTNNLTLHLSITNTNKEQIEWIQSIIGGSITYTKKDNPKHKDTYHLQISGENAYNFAKAAISICRIKREQLLLACVYFETNSLTGGAGTKRRTKEADMFIFNSLRVLNKTGKSSNKEE